MLWHGPAEADHVLSEADELGLIMGLTINCDCIEGDPEWLASLFIAIVSEGYNGKMAAAMESPMRGAMSAEVEDRRQICSRICDMGVVQDLGRLVAGVDRVMESPEMSTYLDGRELTVRSSERDAFDEDDPLHDLYESEAADPWWSAVCHTSPSSPECRRTDD